MNTNRPNDPPKRSLRPGPDRDTTPPRDVREIADILLAGGRLHVDVTVPRTQVTGRMRLLSRAEVVEVTARARKYFAELGMPCDPTTLAAAGYIHEWNAEIAARHLAIAVRDPKDESLPLAILDEWRDCDDDQIAALWQTYQDRVDMLDPLTEGSTLSGAELEEIERAAGKSRRDLLEHFGSRRLALYIISTAARPAS